MQRTSPERKEICVTKCFYIKLLCVLLRTAERLRGNASTFHSYWFQLLVLRSECLVPLSHSSYKENFIAIIIICIILIRTFIDRWNFSFIKRVIYGPYQLCIVPNAGERSVPFVVVIAIINNRFIFSWPRNILVLFAVTFLGSFCFFEDISSIVSLRIDSTDFISSFMALEGEFSIKDLRMLSMLASNFFPLFPVTGRVPYIFSIAKLFFRVQNFPFSELMLDKFLWNTSNFECTLANYFDPKCDWLFG